MADRPVRERHGSEEFRRVSVSAQEGEGIDAFTKAFTNEKDVRRQSVAGSTTNADDAQGAALAVPEKPDDDDDLPDEV